MGKKTELTRAADLFIRGEFYCSRKPESRLHEYDLIKHLAFGTNIDGRTEEFFVYEANPDHVIETINNHVAHDDYWLTVFSDEQPASYDAEGYTILSTEFLMMLPLDNWSFESESKVIKRVKTVEEARDLNRYFGRAATDVEKFDDPNLHFYIGEDNGQPVSYGRYLLLDKTACFLSDIYTLKEHRGKGMAKALCRKMLMDAKQEGAVKSVLASSQMGHPLYVSLGFHDVSKMWVFKKKS